MAETGQVRRGNRIAFVNAITNDLTSDANSEMRLGTSHVDADGSYRLRQRACAIASDLTSGANSEIQIRYQPR